jgi:hypothetical protein
MRPDRLMWAIGLVLAGAVLAGLVLNLVTGLTQLSWAITLAIAVAACLVAWLLAWRSGAGRVPALSVLLGSLRFSPVTGAIVLLAALLAGGAVWLSAASASWEAAPGFAQLWLAPGKGAGQVLGVRDAYPGRHTFRLELRAGPKVTTWNLTLSDGQTWQRTVTAPAGGSLAASLTTPDRVLRVTA